MTHTAHTRVSVHAHMSLVRASETILEPYNSHLLHYQQTEFTLSDTYQESSVIEGCQSLRKSQSRVWRGGEKKRSHFYMGRFNFTERKVVFATRGLWKEVQRVWCFLKRDKRDKRGDEQCTLSGQGHCFYMFSSHFKWSGDIKLCMLQR